MSDAMNQENWECPLCNWQLQPRGDAPAVTAAMTVLYGDEAEIEAQEDYAHNSRLMFAHCDTHPAAQWVPFLLTIQMGAYRAFASLTSLVGSERATEILEGKGQAE